MQSSSENVFQLGLPNLGPGLSSTSDKIRRSERKTPKEKVRSLMFLIRVTPLILLPLSVFGVSL